ncbi:MAG: exodeoxyribonuclease VII large subunit [Lachnospiraceae bacterium]|nr:exodeoxyribonuclease VII large subunit [Lachnospiraceae bacterium]
MEKVFKVTQINTYIKNLFLADYLLNKVQVKGEVSNCKYHSSGHIYFTLKDEGAALKCIMFASSKTSGLNFKMQDGQSVIVSGSIKVFERDGVFQLYANQIKLDGAGNLYEQYEKIKQKLYEEGLFDFEIKKEIPAYPKRVGIVTAKTGAALQDILNIAKRRNPYVQLILYPAKVQGEGAAKTIVEGIQTLDQMSVDTIIIGRGGGSIEDLWAFNEEMVARAIYAAKTPIISAVGHETDNTISDYAADLRAPTPSAACELAIPDVVSVEKTLMLYQDKMKRLMHRILESKKTELSMLSAKLEYLSPKNQLIEKRLLCDRFYDRLESVMGQKVKKYRHQCEILTERLNGASPTNKLKKGYAYITDKNNQPVLSATSLKEEQNITLSFLDGQIDALVKSKKMYEE